MTLYYIDTCIWRDYFENRSDNFRPLGDWAFRCIQKILSTKEQVIYSDIVNNELLKQFLQSEIDNMLEIIPTDLLIKINVTEKEVAEAHTLTKKFPIHLIDALHGVLAKKYDALLITRDKHFYELQNELHIKKPEELL